MSSVVVAAVVAGLVALAMPVFGRAGSGTLTAEVLRERNCRILHQEVVRITQESPQRVEEIGAYEWCECGAVLGLVHRTFWRVGTSTTRSEVETASSHSTTLWERRGSVGGP